MKLLRNRRAYNRWAREAFDYHGDRAATNAPAAFPCYAYTVVTDWGMEEESPRYLYAADLDVMMQDLARAAGG